MPKASSASSSWSGSASERRRSRRVGLDLPLAVPVHVRSALGLHRGIARNISEGGMLIEIEDAPPIGSTVEITISHGYGLRPASPNETFTLTAEVRHQVAWSFIAPAGRQQLRGVGLRFVSTTPATVGRGWLH